MEQNDLNTSTNPRVALHFDLGTFEGFNFRHNGAIDRTLTAEEIVNWNHDGDGEAEFWPSGDHAGVALLFKRQAGVTASDLQALDSLLHDLGGDSEYNFLRIHHAVNSCGYDLSALTVEKVEDQPLHIFLGSSFIDLRRQAAFELFELYFPDDYQVWNRSQCDGLIFDEDRFLDSPSWRTDEIELGDTKALIVVSN